MRKPSDAEFKYDVALSFAGEQRAYVDAVAAELRARGIRPFYDRYEKAELWGKDLYEHLDYVYQRAAEYCIIFASREYADKVWTRHERRSAQARAIEENAEYILPVRFDDTEIPGVRKTITYISVADTTPAELADLVRTKLGPRVRRNFFPPSPDRLFEALDVTDDVEKGYVESIAESFMQSLRRTSIEERRLLFEVFSEGCVSELPENVHIDLDLVRRDMKMPPAEARALLQGLGSVGFDCRDRQGAEDEDDHGSSDMVELRWVDFAGYEDEEEDDYSMANSTLVARAMMLGTSADRCEDCALRALDALDFSALASPLDDGGHRPQDA